MTTLYRVRVSLDGFKGAPGVATYYSLDMATFRDSLATLWMNYATTMPNGATAAVETTGDTIEDTTGLITGSWVGDPVGLGNGTLSGPYAAGAGFMVAWKTSTILDGKRLKGHTFVVPQGNAIFQADGTIADSFRSDRIGAAEAFISAQSESFVIWRRPRLARPAVGKLKALAAREGGHGLVVGATVPDKSSLLRSRRD